MAAAMPAGPPPTTSTSACATTFTSRAGSRMDAVVACMKSPVRRALRSGVVRLPADDRALERHDREEEAAREAGAHRDGRVEQRRVEVVGRLDDHRADALGGADP